MIWTNWISAIDPGKQADLNAWRAAGKQVFMCQIIAVYWPDNTKYYGVAPYDAMLEFAGLPITSPIDVRLTGSANDAGFYTTPLNFTSDIEDSSISFQISNADGEIEDLFLMHGWGVPVEVFYFLPQFEIFKSMWLGYLNPVANACEPVVQLSATNGFQTNKRQLPRAAFYAICPADFPPEYAKLFQIAADTLSNFCPYNRHLTGGMIGLLDGLGNPFLTCNRTSVACEERFGVILTLPYMGFDNKVVNNGVPFQEPTSSKTIDHPRGSEDSLSEPLRCLFGEQFVQQINIVALNVQTNPDHPERGSVTVVGIPGNGPIHDIDLRGVTLNNVPVPTDRLQIRLGLVQQAPTEAAASVPIPNFSGRPVIRAVVTGDFGTATAASLSLGSHLFGLSNIPIYSDPVTFTRGYTTDPAWCGLELMTNRLWGMAVDPVRHYIQDWINLSGWFNSTVTTLDNAGVPDTGPRASFNAEIRGRTAQDQIRDFCMFRRITPPFVYEGKIRTIPFTQVNLASNEVPFFTDRNDLDDQPRNILPERDGAESNSSFRWWEIDLDKQINRVIVSFKDKTLDQWATRPLLFEDRNAQKRAGIAAGDNTLIPIERQYFATGVTGLGEIIRIGNTLLDLGEFDQGGLVNPIGISFNISILDCLSLFPYQIIKVDSTKGKKMFDKYGFQYFRIMLMELNDVVVKLTCQAYPEQYYALLESNTVEAVLRPPGTGMGGNPSGPGGGGGPSDRPSRPKITGFRFFDDSFEFDLGFEVY